MRGNGSVAPRLARRVRLAPAVAALALVACASFPENPPLAAWDASRGYRFAQLALGPGNSDATFVVLALSGGGTRAAAFSYGVMRALEATPLGTTGGSLLDEVDAISSVSGGSFAAAYLGVHGKERFLADFPEDVLHRRLHRELLLQLLNPWHWPRLLSWRYGRSDLAAELYDAKLFARRRYGELRRERPFIVLNATDVGRGVRFSFTQDDFDPLCSDLDGLPVGRAVTASSAFPIAFSPLTLRNHPKTCGWKTPRWARTALERDLERNPMRYDRAADIASYEDDPRPYLHLSDGGLADNIGLRGPALGVTWLESPYPLISLMNEGRIDRVVFVIVDAKPGGSAKIDRSPHPPGVATVLHASATGPMERYSSDTVELSRALKKQWDLERGAMDHMRASCQAFVADLCEGTSAEADCLARETQACFDHFGVVPPAEDPAGKVVFHRIHVRFAAEKDPEERRRLQGIGTWLQLPRDEVERLVDAGGRLLRESPGYRCLLEAIGAERPANPGRCPEERRVAGGEPAG